MEENGEKWGELEKNGGGGGMEISGIAHGMRVVEGCGGLIKWDQNGRKMGENTHFSQSPFSHLSGG